MIDQVVIHVSSGKGGKGAISGRREKFVPRGGPDGGDGGDGGSVYLVADPNVNTLLAFRYTRRFAAEPGGDGARAKRHGKKGADIEIPVPVGTQVWNDDASPPRLAADLTAAGQRALVARGGKGGRGNACFASSTNQFPLLAEEGEPGEELTLRLELKLLADVGIIGVPNAGKSSLLAAVSAARPKIADYPFTTLEPALGVVGWRDQSFVMVDIPGLIEGAHAGAGLGHDFLRHVERTRLLIHLVDGSSQDPLDDYRQTNEELGLFNQELLDKPQVAAVNKIDLPEVREKIPRLKAQLAGQNAPVFFVSAASREGIGALLDRVVQALGETRRHEVVDVPAETDGEVPVLRLRPQRQRFRVYKQDGGFVVEAPMIERIAARIDHDDWNAKVQFYGYLKRMGVVKALEDAGVLPGDTVRIGGTEWDWE